MKTLVKLLLLLLLSILCCGQITSAQTKIKMVREGGVYTLPCNLNGLQIQFTFDTGAADVMISMSEAMFMLKQGYLSDDDIFGSDYYSTADGSVIENTTILIKEMTIGDIVLRNVKASVIDNDEVSCLLGMSAIRKLGRIEFRGDELWIYHNEQSLQNISHQNISFSTPNWWDCEVLTEQNETAIHSSDGLNNSVSIYSSTEYDNLSSLLNSVKDELSENYDAEFGKTTKDTMLGRDAISSTITISSYYGEFTGNIYCFAIGTKYYSITTITQEPKIVDDIIKSLRIE